MKKLFPVFLILGFVFSMITISCKGNAGNEKPKKSEFEWNTVSKAEPGQAQYFNSANKYPSGSVYPIYNDTTRGIDNNTPDGAPAVQEAIMRIDEDTADQVGDFTVTPKKDGLAISLELEPGTLWNHIQFYVCETDGYDGWESADVRTADLEPVSETKYELLFPFTEKDRWYKVWFSFEENEGEPNQRHVNTHDDPDNDPIKIQANGGQGEFNVYSATNFAEYYSPNRGLYLENLIVNLPEGILESEQHLKVRAEACDPAQGKNRWESGNEKYYVIDDIRDEIWFPSENTQNQDEQAFVNILKGCGNLFFTVSAQVYFDGIEYEQTIYGNWADGYYDEGLDEYIEFQDSNWFVDYEVMPSDATKLPVIRIDQNDGKAIAINLLQNLLHIR